MNVLVKLGKLLDKHGIGYIVIGSLADHLLGVSMVEPRDIDILVSGEDVGRLGSVIQQVRDIDILEPIRWREGGTVRGVYGRALLDGVPIDIMANIQLKYLGKWIFFTYERLHPCTIEAKINEMITVRIPCPEIQAIADKVLGRMERARALENLTGKKRCSVKINQCLTTIDR
ncbi:MAG: hypothetical protein GSR86_02755 [Desulfurococcales archaeon]|nr:hypothetical protein [Desulfurococcales archaeon]